MRSNIFPVILIYLYTIHTHMYRGGKMRDLTFFLPIEGVTWENVRSCIFPILIGVGKMQDCAYFLPL